MKQKLAFKEAIEVAFEMRNVMMAAFQDHDYGISHHELMALFMLTKKWNCQVKLSAIKQEIKSHHSFEEFKKIEIMLAKKLTALENAQFITRTKGVDDKRETEITVTPLGQDLIKQFIANAEGRWERCEGQACCHK